MTKEIVTRQYQLGRLLCGGFRNMLAECKMFGMEIEWHESGGWISRTFTVRGPKSSLMAIEETIKSRLPHAEIGEIP